jgi:SAM-dependent methyltransferase
MGMNLHMKKDNGTLRNFDGAVPATRVLENESSHFVHEQLARLKFIDSCIDLKGKRVLDMGCGTGYSCFYVCERSQAREVVGMDSNEHAIRYGRTNYSAPGVEYIVHDCLTFSPALGLFDVVICNEVIEHVQDQESFLTLLGNYLVPEGFAVISTPNKAVFSFGKNTSFLNDMHVRELFFDEFVELVKTRFSLSEFYSQKLSPRWHPSFINYLSAQNVINALRTEIFSNRIAGRIVSGVYKYMIFLPFFILKSKKYPDIRRIRFGDFDFVKGNDNRALWFVAIVSHPKS